MGFASRVVQGTRVDVIKEAIKMARVISSKSPVAVAGTKRMMLYSRDHSVAEGLEMTATWNSAMLQSTDTSLAIKAATVKGKDRPTFEGLLIEGNGRDARPKL